MWSENYRWHFDYVRLAWDTSFGFEKQKTGNLDKGKVCLIDVEKIIEERDFASVEHYIPLVIQYALEGEQAAVLDNNFVKVFRMSQLSIQYLLFCKKYLDNTVVLLKNELSKLKEENNELKAFNEELKEHVSLLIKKIRKKQMQEDSPSHKCEKCSKLFTTEQFLSSHIKRRHGAVDQDKTDAPCDTDRLHSEIKMLKERLNSTERLIQHEQKPVRDVEYKESEMKMNELQQKFEIWKLQVENELKLIQTQKNFEDKYEKWFENILDNLKESLVATSKKNIEIKEIDTMEVNVLDKGKENIVRKESTTQTDLDEVFLPEEANVEVHDNVPDAKVNAEIEVLPLIQEQMNKFEENVNIKVTTSFQKIENQLDSFWDKLNKIEEVTKSPIHQHSIQPKSVHYTEDTKPFIKPRTKIKKSSYTESIPETGVLQGDYVQNKSVINVSPKLQHRSHERDSNTNKEIIDNESYGDRKDELNNHGHLGNVNPDVDHNKQTFKKTYSSKTEQYRKSMSPQKNYMKRYVSSKQNIKETSESDSESESSSEESESAEEIVRPMEVKSKRKSELALKETTSKLANQQLQTKRLKKTADKPSSEVMVDHHNQRKHSTEKVGKEIHLAINERLQIIGISPDWRGLPEKSFQRAMEIINHQATLTEKNLKNYQKVRTQIIQNIAKKVKGNTGPDIGKKISKPKKKPINQITTNTVVKSPVKIITRADVENLSKDKNWKHISPKASPAPDLKKQKMYLTDSDESELLDNQLLQVKPQKETETKQDSRPYSAVIRELKMRSSEIIDSNDSLSEVSIIKETRDDIQIEKDVEDHQTKGVLKNYPSVNSLAKKKVLFDIDSDSSKVDEKPTKERNKDGGSTTSVGSSVLDGTPRNEVPKGNLLKQEKNKDKDLEDLSDFDF